MKPIIKNILAVISGGFIGSIVNMSLIIIGSKLILPPEGVNHMDAESLQNNIHLFELKHFLFPFLAHAGGTLVGAFSASKISASHHFIFALVIGAFFQIGGIAMASSLEYEPLLYSGVDLIFAYIPMAWLGWKLSGKSK